MLLCFGMHNRIYSYCERGAVEWRWMWLIYRTGADPCGIYSFIRSHHIRCNPYWFNTLSKHSLNALVRCVHTQKASFFWVAANRHWSWLVTACSHSLNSLSVSFMFSAEWTERKSSAINQENDAHMLTLQNNCFKIINNAAARSTLSPSLFIVSHTGVRLSIYECLLE